tara:strand:+ start:456 stop:692 length:237 start_codon:yes stop_codon:yes gene_type:complete
LRISSGRNRWLGLGQCPYIGDSDICTAALHGCAVAREGGTVHVIRIQGRKTCTASSTNMLQARAWGSYSSSIVFDRNQ